jgi:hypothetical protein
MPPRSSATTTTSSGSSTLDPDTKILQDLSTLSEQITLCQSMLASNRHSIDANNNNEALLTVIGFLEACAPRMLELIEIAAQGGGVLKDETFEECLVVNDKLTNVLADLDQNNNNDSGGIGATSAAAATTAASAAAVGGGGLSTSDDSDAIDLGMQNLSMGWGTSGDGGDNHPDKVVGGKTSGLDDSEDLLGIGLDDHASSSSAAPPPSNPFLWEQSTEVPDASNDNDDFDAFFRDRTVAP